MESDPVCVNNSSSTRLLFVTLCQATVLTQTWSDSISCSWLRLTHSLRVCLQFAIKIQSCPNYTTPLYIFTC